MKLKSNSARFLACARVQKQKGMYVHTGYSQNAGARVARAYVSACVYVCVYERALDVLTILDIILMLMGVLTYRILPDRGRARSAYVYA